MKKVKVQFDQKKIQEFLLQNVEKIVLGIVVLVFSDDAVFCDFGRRPVR